MSDKTPIEWTDATWNPVRGCSRVSAGCANCYAEKTAARFSGPGQPYDGMIMRDDHGARWSGKVTLFREQLDIPRRWRRPRRIFVNSMSDLFHEDLDPHDIAEVFAAMARVQARHHTYQILTKRAAGMRELLNDPIFEAEVRKLVPYHIPWPLPHVWLGVSVEHQEAADERIPDLLATSAEVRFLSCEPLLGPLDLVAKSYRPWGPAGASAAPLSRIAWVIAGGESGSGARMMAPSWARDIRDQCAQTGVPFFFKQWGAWAPEGTCGGVKYSGDTHGPETPTNEPLVCLGKKKAGRLLDGQLHDGYPAAMRGEAGDKTRKRVGNG